MNDDASAPSRLLKPVSGTGSVVGQHRSIGEAVHRQRLRLSVILAASLLAMTAMARTTGPMAIDKMIDVGGTVLHFRVTPGCSPTILLEAGGSLDSSEWTKLEPQLHAATGAAVISYDRAGFGRSHLPHGTYGIDRQVTWLRQGLRKAEVPEDVVFVGHSYGALLAQLYAHRYPEITKGIVLLDPQNVAFVDAIGGPSVLPFQMPASPPKLVAASTMMRDSFPADLDVIRQAPFPDTVPITVVAAGMRWLPTDAWNDTFDASRKAIVTGFPNRHLVVAERSGHMISDDRPDVVISSVQAMVDEVRHTEGAASHSRCSAPVAAGAPR
jgi:pimeloyl-ACP methyl ester carboxylesterase